MKPIILAIGAMCLLSFANGKTAGAADENYILIAGLAPQPQKVLLNKVDCHWFVNSRETYFILALSGSINGRDVMFNVRANSKGPAITIARDEQLQFKKNEDVNLVVNKEDKSGDYICQPEGSDAVLVTIKSIDNTAISITFKGSLTFNDEVNGGNKPVIINGAIALTQKYTPVILNTAAGGTPADCDNTIYDKIPNAEDRTATECEVKFDYKVREAAAQSMQKVAGAFTNGWNVTQTPLQHIESVARVSERKFYGLGAGDLGDYRFTLEMDQSNPQAAVLQQQIQQLMSGSLPGADELKKKQLAMNDMAQAMKADVYITINAEDYTIENFTTEHTVLNMPGFAKAVIVRGAQSDGGSNMGTRAEFLCLGAWGNINVVNNGDGTERIVIKGAVNQAAPHLSVQNITIKIEGNKELTDKIINLIDFSKLKALLQN